MRSSCAFLVLVLENGLEFEDEDEDEDDYDLLETTVAIFDKVADKGFRQSGPIVSFWDPIFLTRPDSSHAPLVPI